MTKPSTISIDNVEYVRKDSIINVESSPLCKSWVGKYVICRTRNEGINAGIVSASDETGVILKDCRRLHYHGPKDKSLSWYEGVAVSGLSDKSKVSCPVASKLFSEDYSLTECSEVAEISIRGFKTYEQN